MSSPSTPRRQFFPVRTRPAGFAPVAAALLLIMTLHHPTTAPRATGQPDAPDAPNAPDAPPLILLDTDIESDCDDAGTLAVLHALADRGECRILAMGVSSTHPWSAPCVAAINGYYGRRDLPVGVPRHGTASMPSRYAEAVARSRGLDTAFTDAAPDAATLYRRLLAEQPDGSVTLVTVGYMTNVARLLTLPAEDGLPSGADVARTKLRQWVCMGGNFIGSPARDDLKLGNNNFTTDAPAAFAAITNWPAEVPLVFAGREVCSVPSGLVAGARLVDTPEDNPVRLAYARWFNGPPRDRHVADLVAVLFAVRGPRDYWHVHDTGAMDLRPDMTFDWIEEPPTPRRQGYLLKRPGPDGKPNDRTIEAVLTELLIQPPRGQ